MTEQQLILIPHKPYLTFTEVLLYTGRSSAWFYKLKKEYLIPCSAKGYYKRADIDKIFEDKLKPNRGEPVANTGCKPLP